VRAIADRQRCTGLNAVSSAGADPAIRELDENTFAAAATASPGLAVTELAVAGSVVGRAGVLGFLVARLAGTELAGTALARTALVEAVLAEAVLAGTAVAGCTAPIGNAVVDTALTGIPLVSIGVRLVNAGLLGAAVASEGLSGVRLIGAARVAAFVTNGALVVGAPAENARPAAAARPASTRRPKTPYPDAGWSDVAPARTERPRRVPCAWVLSGACPISPGSGLAYESPPT